MVLLLPLYEYNLQELENFFNNACVELLPYSKLFTLEIRYVGYGSRTP